MLSKKRRHYPYCYSDWMKVFPWEPGMPPCLKSFSWIPDGQGLCNIFCVILQSK